MEDQQRTQSQLFQVSSGFGNAVLNFRDRADDEFNLYAQSFHRAAQSLAEQMLSKAGYNDLDACPIIFLYRHALELYLKAIGRIGRVILDLAEHEQPITDGELIGHKISKFLPALKRIFGYVGWNWELDIEGLSSFEDLEKLLQDFDSIDTGSDAFRYPLNRNEEASVAHHFVVNVPKFCQQMDELLNLLDGATTGLREIHYLRLEEAYQAQNSVDDCSQHNNPGAAD
jgi:hypothetical protein